MFGNLLWSYPQLGSTLSWFSIVYFMFLFKQRKWEIFLCFLSFIYIRKKKENIFVFCKFLMNEIRYFWCLIRWTNQLHKRFALYMIDIQWMEGIHRFEYQKHDTAKRFNTQHTSPAAAPNFDWPRNSQLKSTKVLVNKSQAIKGHNTNQEEYRDSSRVVLVPTRCELCLNDLVIKCCEMVIS